MIKKSVFEDDLIAGMQRELRSHEKKQGMNNLVKAADYLQAAVEIFEEAGMTAKADQVLRILGKIALAAPHHDTKVKSMPSMKALMEAGVTQEDLKGVGKGDAFSKARVNTAFRSLGYTDKEIADLIGHKNMMSEEEAADLLNPERSFGKIKNWIENPTTPIDPQNPQAGEEISFDSLPNTRPGDTISFESAINQKDMAPGKNDLVFKSIATDTHTQGLTSDKMVANLENHGTVFNMADDGAADDLLDLDLNEAALEVFEDGPQDKTFEDSD